MMRAAARYAVAAEQDEKPMIQVLHANYAMGYMLALREIASDMEVYQVTGYDPHAMFKWLLEVQDRAAKAVVAVCPELVPGPEWVARLAGEG